MRVAKIPEPVQTAQLFLASEAAPTPSQASYYVPDPGSLPTGPLPIPSSPKPWSAKIRPSLRRASNAFGSTPGQRGKEAIPSLSSHSRDDSHDGLNISASRERLLPLVPPADRVEGKDHGATPAQHEPTRYYTQNDEHIDNYFQTSTRGSVGRSPGPTTPLSPRSERPPVNKSMSFTPRQAMPKTLIEPDLIAETRGGHSMLKTHHSSPHANFQAQSKFPTVDLAATSEARSSSPYLAKSRHRSYAHTSSLATPPLPRLRRQKRSSDSTHGLSRTKFALWTN